MSWSLQFSSLEALDRDEPTSGTIPEDARDQYEAARAAAIDLITSGAIGRVGAKFTTLLSGHANPEHEPREGWANDCITVSIYQATNS